VALRSQGLDALVDRVGSENNDDRSEDRTDEGAELMGLLDKVKELFSQNTDKVDEAIDKVGGIVDDKTQGKYKDVVDKAQEAAKSAIDKDKPADSPGATPGGNPGGAPQN
jgi:hypothetical protein